MSACRSCEAEIPPRHRLCFRCRLWSYIQVGDPEVCWVWSGALNRTRYGFISLPGDHKGNVLAHRAVWEERNGPIPEGLCVLHRCDTRVCCNPAHLFLGTQAENMADMDAKGRRRVGTLRGANNPQAKLTEETVRRIRALHGEGYPKIGIARLLCVSRRAVQLVLDGTTWRHVS